MGWFHRKNSEKSCDTDTLKGHYILQDCGHTFFIPILGTVDSIMEPAMFVACVKMLVFYITIYLMLIG